MRFDRTYLTNPLWKYLSWLGSKIYYQHKYRGKNLLIGYLAFVRSGRFGKYNWIGAHNTIIDSSIGDYTYIAGNSAILHCTIGKFCSIGTGVKIAIGTHPTSGIVSTHPALYCKPDFHCISFTDENKFPYKEEVVIGNDVWIAANVVILNGVTIADGAVIAANSVVNKDVNPYEIVGGVPAKLIRKRFTDEEIEVLLEVKWWDKPEEWIRENISKFWSVSDFAESFKKQ